MQIKTLEKLVSNPTLHWGFNGYETDKIFAVSVIKIENSFEFTLREKNQYYRKVWEITDKDIDYLNKIIEQGNSFGAFENDELVGWAICGFRKRNNSLFIENMLISEKYRGQNLGKLFIKNINRKARELQCSLVELETQNTHYPAIKFYQNTGFSITGINTKQYSDSTETAVYMSFDVLL